MGKDRNLKYKKDMVQAAAQRKAGKKRFKGEYAGPDKYKGVIPEGYKGKAKGKYFGKDSREGKNYDLKKEKPENVGPAPVMPTLRRPPTKPTKLNPGSNKRFIRIPESGPNWKDGKYIGPTGPKKGKRPLVSERPDRVLRAFEQ